MKYSKMMMMIQKVLNEQSDVQIDFCMSSQFANKIELWSRMYEKHPPWLREFGDTVNLPVLVSSEIARLVTLELKTEIKGSARATFLDKIYQKIITKLRIYTEYGCAKGGLIFKPYPSQGGIGVQTIQADAFFPISFDDSSNITQCVFLEQFRRGSKIYSRLEIHKLENTVLTITNRAFLSTNDFTLGSEVSLQSIDRWSSLEYSAVFSGVEKLPFGYFKVPLANSDDSDSPLGVSVFSNAVSHIKEADKRYCQINWEYDSKETAVHIAESLLRYNPNTDKHEYPAGKDRLYRSLEYNSGAMDKPLLDVFSPDIRNEAFFDGFNHQLRLVEFACNLAYGTLSDPNNVDKTAEEIKASKQRSYQMVSDTQGAMQTALEDLVYAMDVYASLYDLAPSGSYTINFVWDDSIIADVDKTVDRNIKLTQAGLKSKLSAIMENNRCTEEEAMEELKCIHEEQQITGQDVDWTDGDDE